MKLRQISVMRNEQNDGRYINGNTEGHHHVLWELNGHQEPRGKRTLGPLLNEKGLSATSRHTASTSGE